MKKSLPYLLVVCLLAAFFVLPLGDAVGQVDDEDIATLNTVTSEDENTDDDQTGAWELLVQMLVALSIVLILMFALMLLIRRFMTGKQLPGGGRNDAIRIISTKMLGARRSLVLVRVRGQTLLLGMTPQRIDCLTEIHELDGEWAQPAETESDGKNSAFERHLGRFVNQTVGDDASEETVS